METPTLCRLEPLTDVGLRNRVDFRPALLRILTDLYVQRHMHTADEERHYTELALRLLDSVDVTTRAAVAVRLAQHLSPPAQVVQRLARDLPEIVAPLRWRSLSSPSAASEAAQSSPATLLAEDAADQADRERTSDSPVFAAEPEPIAADVASELNELFFAASADERRLILLNLDSVASPPAGRAATAADPALGRQLEAAALARKREEFVQVLARLLRTSREQAQRIAGDQLGEPIVVAAKTLNIPGDRLYRILLFANPVVGRSVERIHALTKLYDRISAQAAADLVSIWQDLHTGTKKPAASHQPLLAADRLGRQPATMSRKFRPAGSSTSTIQISESNLSSRAK